MNNRKQKVNAFLDSITEKELNEYIENKKLNKNFDHLLEKIRKYKPQNHTQKLQSSINEKLEEAIQEYYKIGQAYIIAFVLECFYDDKYKIQDLKYYLKEMIKKDNELKEYVYEIIKDF